jgi:hypothetical protein
MATVGETSRPGYVYDSATDVWIPVGIGPHSHTPAAIGAISSSVVTTKGDLIVATGSGVVTRQGVGADGSYLVADSTQADGLNWAGPSNMAGRNAVLNSNFSVWQRGTSFNGAFSTGTGTYTADRWLMYVGAGLSTVSRQVTGDTTNLPFIQYCTRVARDSGQTTTNTVYFANGFESVNSIPLAGKTVVLSFYARAGANYSSASNALLANVITGTGTDQNVISGLTGGVNAISQTATLTTTWQRFTYSATLSSTATQVAVRFDRTPVGTAGANDYYEVTGVQLEVGSVATPYAPNGATYQAELAACQRYYMRFAGGQTFSRYVTGYSSNTNTAFFNFPLPVSMRVGPTAVDYSTLILDNGFGTSAAVTTVVLTANCQSPTTGSISLNVASGLTADRNYQIENNNSTAGYIGFSAEL